MPRRVLPGFDSCRARHWGSGPVAWLAVFVLLATACQVATADGFDWRTVAGQSYVTSVKNQNPGGMCWAFSATAALEAKYMLTRNDPNFAPDMSEQNLVCPGTMGNSVTGGWEFLAMDYFTTTGIVSEAELPYTAKDTSPNWPLADGWESRVWKVTSDKTWLGSDVAMLKSALKTYGPLVTFMTVDIDWYSPAPGAYRGFHDVLVTGYQDDPAAPGGGYWIIKNSWGASWNGDGYGKIAYATLANDSDASGRIHALDGAAYYTGAMATANWTGGSGTWKENGGNWTTGSSAYSWENKETSAVFDAAGPATAIAIDGKVIAHGLTFNAGATGYTLSGGSLTVTGGGILANESVTIDAPVTVGAPQTWLAAAGKTLTIGGDVHTVISTLTVTALGDVYIGGALDGGGALNAAGAPAGNLTKIGPGQLTIAGASNYDGAIAISSGTLNLAPSAGLTATYSGRISGRGGLTKSGDGTAVLGEYNTYTGSTTVNGGTLQVTGWLTYGGSNKVFVAKDGNGILGDGIGDARITRRVVQDDVYAGIGAAILNTLTGELASKADLLDGTASAQADVTMAWRTRTAAEKASGGLVSEVLGLSGVAPTGAVRGGSHATDLFVLQISYDPAQLLSASGLTEAQAAAQGLVALGALDLGVDGVRGTADDRWGRAVDGDFGGVPLFVGDRPYDSTFFVLGDYGVNTSAHVAWAVLNHNSEFAVVVVPEPSTVTLLLCAVAAFVVITLRRDGRGSGSIAR